MGGIRTSTVNVLATATLGPYVGVDTLGVPIVNANVHGEAGRLGTAMLVAALAIFAELLLAAAQRRAHPARTQTATTHEEEVLDAIQDHHARRAGGAAPRTRRLRRRRGQRRQRAGRTRRDGPGRARPS